MNSRNRRLFRVNPLALALVFSSFLSLLPSVASAAGPGKPHGGGVLATTTAPPVVQTWTLINGNQVEGALVAYSMQSRIITLRIASDRIAHLTPRDLTALSKLKWLSSPVVIKAIQSYRWPDGWGWTLAEALAAPVMGILLGGYLCYWLAAGLVMREKRAALAATSFLRSLLRVALIVCLTGFMVHAANVALGSSPLASAVRGVALAFGVVATFILISFQTGGDYAQSAVMGLGTVLTGLILGTLLGAVGFFLLPQALGQPGLDQWLTNRLLNPLGLV